jgi:hypothetical protein
MMRRAGPRAFLAAAILSAWAIVLSVHAWRTAHVPSAERFAAAARSLPPGDSWYAIFHGRERAGWARRQLDTLSGGRGFVLRERSVRGVRSLGETARTETDLVAWLDAGIRLDSLVFRSMIGIDTSRLELHAEGDTVIVLQPGGRRRVSDRPQLAGSWPLRFASDQAARQSGQSVNLILFDPSTALAHETLLRVGDSELRTWADSADTDPDTDEWIVVRQDTVRAWRIERVVGNLALPVWVDEDGRVLEAEEPGGLRLERTAFELAFFTAPVTGEGTR